MARSRSLTASLPIWTRLWRRLSPSVRAERPLVVTTLVALVAETALRVLEPWPLKFVFDTVLSTRHRQALPEWASSVGPEAVVLGAAIALLAFTGLRAGAAYVSTVAGALAGNRVVSRLRDDLFTHLQRLPLAFHAKARAGDLTVRLVGDIGVMKDVAVTALLPLVASVLVLGGMGVVMLSFNWKLGLLAMLLLPLVALTTGRLGRRIHHTAREQRRHEGDLAARAAESIVGVRVVRALSLESEFGKSFRAGQAGSLTEGVRGKRLEARLERTADLLVAAVTAAVLWLGAHLVIGGELSPGDLLVFLAYLKTGFRPINDFAKYSGRIAKAAAAADRVLDVLEVAPDGEDRPGAVPAPAFAGRVEFDHVSFAYEWGRPALADVSIDVPPGSHVFVVGPSGSGKSTMVSLLMRLFEPTKGTIRIDGHDIAGYTADSVRQQCSIVLQDAVLFAGTVRENLVCGQPGVGDEQMIEASRLADAHDFIMRLPGGYDSKVGERGVTFSAGQRQRLAIARAALRRTPLVVLDEPTTGLDDVSKAQVLAALDRLGRGRTTFFITHEVALARRRADLVIWIDQGRIVEMGRPDELADAGGRYAAALREVVRLTNEVPPRAVAG